jgi:hypothetical protein
MPKPPSILYSTRRHFGSTCPTLQVGPNLASPSTPCIDTQQAKQVCIPGGISLSLTCASPWLHMQSKVRPGLNLFRERTSPKYDRNLGVLMHPDAQPGPGQHGTWVYWVSAMHTRDLNTPDTRVLLGFKVFSRPGCTRSTGTRLSFYPGCTRNRDTPGPKCTQDPDVPKIRGMPRILRQGHVYEAVLVVHSSRVWHTLGRDALWSTLAKLLSDSSASDVAL